MRDNYLTVSALYQYINRKFINDPYLKTVYVVGEASNVSHKSNGYIYFNLKDDKATIKVVSFVFARQKAPFKIEEGQKLLVVGHVSTYDQGSNYQIQMTHFELAGMGALFEQLKILEAKLRQEGLFDLPKKAIPKMPQRIAVLTSDTGAVLHDIRTTVLRRFPIVQLDVYPTIVQGKGSVDSIITNLNRVLTSNIPYDTVILGRGGGSIEDLWSFNDEKVVRTVSAFPLPIISCVGHETDTTLVDFVSDIRAATPTAAAEIATPDLRDVYDKLLQLSQRLMRDMRHRLDRLQKIYAPLANSVVFTRSERLYDPYFQKVFDFQEKLERAITTVLDNRNRRLDHVDRVYMMSNPAIYIDEQQKRLPQLEKQLIQAHHHITLLKNSRLNVAMEKLDALSPLKSLQRGYSIVSVNDKVVTSIVDVKKDERLIIDVTDGQIVTDVIEVREK